MHCTITAAEFDELLIESRLGLRKTTHTNPPIKYTSSSPTSKAFVNSVALFKMTLLCLRCP